MRVSKWFKRGEGAEAFYETLLQYPQTLKLHEMLLKSIKFPEMPLKFGNPETAEGSLETT